MDEADASGVMIKLLLLVAAIPVVLIGSIRVAVRLLRFVRKYRGAVAQGLAEEGVRGFIAEALESWVDAPASSESTSDHVAGDAFEAPHGHSAETASHSD